MMPGSGELMINGLKIQDTRKLLNEAGYTMIEVIIVASIITILLTIGSAHYLEAKRLAMEQLAATRLANIDGYQQMYFREFATYATFQELQAKGYIDSGYTSYDNVLSESVPYVPEYNLTFNVSTESYQVIAQPVHGDFAGFYVRWRISGGIEEERGMFVDQNGVVRYLSNNRPVF
jgi:prepilin-type N-terminal cleavage/methylation domain-containing protein